MHGIVCPYSSAHVGLETLCGMLFSSSATFCWPFPVRRNTLSLYGQHEGIIQKCAVFAFIVNDFNKGSPCATLKKS